MNLESLIETRQLGRDAGLITLEERAENRLICAHMACTFFGLSPLEAVQGITRCGAAAMGLGDSAGSIAVGRQADFTVWDLAAPDQLVYQLGGLYPDRVYVGGEPI